MVLIAIAGGIGSGKSVVSRILSAMNYPVYDCDSEAKRLMDSSDTIKSAISKRIYYGAISSDNRIDRSVLAEIVFKDKDKLRILNEIVHSAFKEDILKWCRGKNIAFVETAILYQSGLDKIVDMVWEVVAPKEIRILRVIKRNNMSAEQVLDRIKAQDDFLIEEKHPATYIINNDGDEPVLPQINNLLTVLRK